MCDLISEFMFGCAGSSLLRGFLLAAASAGCCSLQCGASASGGVPHRAARAAELNSVGPAGLDAPRLGSLSGSGLEPVFPALMGRFFTPELKGNSCCLFF